MRQHPRTEDSRDPAERLAALGFAAYVDTLRACRLCPGVVPPPVVGAVPQARVVLIGQAPGPREREQGRPFAYTAGTTLFRWFAALGVDEESFRARVHMGAAIRCFPGKLPNRTGDRRPAREEIETCSRHWRAELRLLRPALVLLVGRLAIDLLVRHARLDEVVGRQFAIEREGQRFDAVPLPHPSGLSRWVQSERGRRLLGQALGRLAAHPAWRETFPEAAGPGAAAR